MPVTVTAAPSTSTRNDAALGTVSVVMMARAAANQPSARAAARAAGNPLMILSTGSGSMITPVENGSTSSGAQSMRRATATHSARASAKPRSPVPALALPALTTSARKLLPVACCRAMFSRQTITGAAQKRFCVNTPAATVPGSQRTRRTSSRVHFLIAAAAAPSATPGTGSSDSAEGGV